MFGTGRASLGLAAALVAALGFAGVAAAGEAGRDEEGTTPPVVVTATRVEQPVEQVGSAVTVISGEELRRRGIVSVADALDEVPGATVPRSGTRGKSASFFLRGANPEQTLILIDGVRANDAVDGGFDLSLLSTDDIERIEVIRGPQSTLYGSDALGGVVNIITRKGAGRLSASATARAGNYDTTDLGAALSGGGGLGGGSLSVSRFDTDNRFPNDDSELTTLSGRLDAMWSKRVSSTVTLRRSALDTGTPGQTALAPPNLVNRQTSDLRVFGVATDVRVTEGWSQRLFLSRSEQELDFVSSFGPFETDSVTRAAEWVHTVKPWGPFELLLGGEYRVEDAESGAARTHFVTRAAFAQVQLALFRDRLFVQGGGRYDDGSQLSSELTPKVAAAFLVPESGTRLHASWGKGIKAPSLIDLFFPAVGNPDLEPQRVTGWDAGVDQELAEGRLALGATFFRNDFENFIFVTPDFTTINLEAVHAYGLESTAKLRPARFVELAATYTYLEARNDDFGEQLLRRPRNQGSASLTLFPVPAASFTLSGLYVGKRRDNVFSGTDASRYVGSYTRVDASATYRLPRPSGAPAATLLARVENLLDRRYEEVLGFEALGISVLAGVQVTF